MMTWFAGELLWRGSPWAPIFTIIIAVSLLILSHYSLLMQSGKGRAIRLILLSINLYFIFDMAYNIQYTFGSAFRDTTWGTIAWHFFGKALDVGLVFDLEGKPLPQWCVPDWEKESKERPKATHSALLEKQISFHNGKVATSKRLEIPPRPEWAVETHHLPVHWKLLPLPIHFKDQVIWTMDVCFLRRHGTSFLLPNQMRALDWSQKKLERAGKAHRASDKTSMIRLKDPEVIPFGYSETPFIDATLQVIAVYFATDYFSKMDLPVTKPGGFYGLPMRHQLIITCSMGIPISLFTDLSELLVFPLLQKWPINLPNTSLVPMFRNVVRSKTLTEMWGYRWHTFTRREFIRLGSLFSVGSHLPALTVLKTFLWSAIFHSFIFIRFQPRPTLSSPSSWVRPMYLPGCFALFLGQGLLVIAENVIRPIVLRSKMYQKLIGIPAYAFLLSCLQTLYVYGTLIFMARWVAAEVFRFNLLSSEQVQSMKMQSQMRDYAEYWSDRYRDIQDGFR